MIDIKYENVVKVLLEEIPDLMPRYEKAKAIWNEDGHKEDDFHKVQTIAFSWALTPYIVELLNADNQEQKLKEVFDFLETLTMQNDMNVKSLVAVPIMEDLDNEGLKQKARKYMGTNTTSISFAPHGWIV